MNDLILPAGNRAHLLSVLLQLLMFIVAHKLVVEGIYVGLIPLLSEATVVLALLVRLLPLFLSVVKGAYFRFIAASSLYKVIKMKLLHRRIFSCTCPDGTVAPQLCGTCCTSDPCHTCPNYSPLLRMNMPYPIPLIKLSQSSA